MDKIEVDKTLTSIRDAIYAIIDSNDPVEINTQKLKIATLTSLFKFDEVDIPILVESFKQFSEDLNKYVDTSISDTNRQNLGRQVLQSYGSFALAVSLFSSKDE